MSLLPKKDFLVQLRRATKARIGLERTGVSLSTKDQLELMMAFAKAKDAIFFQPNYSKIQAELTKALPSVQIIQLKSKVSQRQEYLKRPDLARELTLESVKLLESSSVLKKKINFLIIDGLSPFGVEKYAAQIAAKTFSLLDKDYVGDIFLIEQGRVGICDRVGHCIDSLMTVVLIGERPGLTTYDSVGAYLTYQPRLGKTDADRNCISNICDTGLSIDLASEKLAGLIKASLDLKLSGTELKEDTQSQNIFDIAKKIRLRLPT